MAFSDDEIEGRAMGLESVCREKKWPVTGDRLVREQVAAEILGVRPKTLRNDRSCERRWPYLKRGRVVFYSLRDLAVWIAENPAEPAF
jgi:hypothetical protein